MDYSNITNHELVQYYPSLHETLQKEVKPIDFTQEISRSFILIFKSSGVLIKYCQKYNMCAIFLVTLQARRKHEGREEGGLPLLDQVEEVYRRAITTTRPHSIILVGR